MIEIEKGVPLPESATCGPGRRSPYPFREMAVGDSFLVKGKIQGQVSSLALGWVGTACIGVAELDEAGVTWCVFDQCGHDAVEVAQVTSEPAARMWLDDIAQEWRGGQW